MTRTEELLALAKAALGLDHNETEGWYKADYIQEEGAYYQKDARFIAAANPETIKQLVELCRLQHEALVELSPCMHKECCQLQNQTQDHAISAFNKFEGGE